MAQGVELMKLEVEFEIRKLQVIADKKGFTLVQEDNLVLPTFYVLDEYLDDAKVATIQWTGENWACVGFRPESIHFCPVLKEACSCHFWEISY